MMLKGVRWNWAEEVEQQRQVCLQGLLEQDLASSSLSESERSVTLSDCPLCLARSAYSNELH